MRPSRIPIGSALKSMAGLGACAVALSAQAMSIRELHTLEASQKDGASYASYYLVGVVEGLREAGDTAQREGASPLFCVEGRRLEPAMARSLYEAELKRHAERYEADMPVQLVMLQALRTSYRCSR